MQQGQGAITAHERMFSEAMSSGDFSSAGMHSAILAELRHKLFSTREEVLSQDAYTILAAQGGDSGVLRSALKRVKCRTIGDLITISQAEFLEKSGNGPKALTIVTDRLARLGLHLGMSRSDLK